MTVPDSVFDKIKSHFFRMKDAVPFHIRNDYVRGIYVNMLDTLGNAATLEFWRGLPLNMGGQTYRDGSLFRYLWNSDNPVPMVYDYCVGDCLEPFLLNQGRDTREFLNGIFMHNNQSTYVSGKTVLSNLEPVVFDIFKYEDLKEGLLDLAHIHTEKFLVNHRHRIAKVERLPGGEKKIYMAYITDSHFQNLIEYDNDFLTGIALGNLPRMMKMDPFEAGSITNICDSRSIDYVLWEELAAAWKGDQLFIAGKPHGVRARFSEFCRRKSLDLAPLGVPDRDVVEIHKDYTCPFRKRIVLREGCVYGAPLYVQVIKYRFEGHSTKRHLEAIVNDINEKEGSPRTGIEAKHEALVALTDPANFVYHESDQRLDLNGLVFMKGKAAEILSEILSIYQASGGKRDVFEFAYFKKLKGFTVGFEVHLSRIKETLRDRSMTMRIISIGKGTFKFESDVPIDIKIVTDITKVFVSKI